MPAWKFRVESASGAEMPLMTSCLRRFAFPAMAFAAASASFAIVPHQPEGVPASAAATLSGVPFVLPAVEVQESKAWAASDPPFRAFVREAGVEWQARWDRRTARLSAAFGSFPSWLAADARVATPDEHAVTLALLDTQCRALLQRHAGLFRVPSPVTLRLDGRRSVPIDGGRVWQVSYEVLAGGVPVEGAAIFFRLNSGRLVQLGQEGLADALTATPTTPLIDGSAASALAGRDIAALFPSEKVSPAPVAEPRLALVPWSDSPRAFAGAPGSGLRYELAWRTSQRVPGRIETWTAWHDAITGERLALWDDNEYACPVPATPQGRVVGGVYLGAIEEVSETLRGMPYALVQNGTPKVADENGIFPYTVGQPASTSLSGSFFDMNCLTCANPAQADGNSSGWGYLTLGIGGNDITGNGRSTKAERNCFYHLNTVRQIASKHLADAAAGGFLSRTTPANVNFAFTCNAFWDGNSVNFFRAGGGCNNTGEIADVMQHEWGHGLDQFTGGGTDGARGEGIGDVVAFMSTHDSRLGPYFVTGDGGGIRNADENVGGVKTTTNIATFCPADGNGGPLGFQVHCEGGIFAQAWWHLARNLRQKMVAAGGSDAAGWFIAEKLFFASLPTSRTYVPSGAQPTYDAVMVVDDDNGNLADGTPNATEINEAFEHHGMAATPQVTDSADCVAPPAPAITLMSAQQPGSGLWQVRVSWTDTPGASEYRVFRNQADGAGADEQVASVTAPVTEFFDDDVVDGVTYRYRVTAFLPNGCISIAENQQPITLGLLANVALESWSFDDSGNPGANFNGIAEPGETLVIAVSGVNAGTARASAVIAEISSPDPGVTIVRGTQALGNMNPGASASTVAPHFAVLLDRTRIACGSSVPFVVSFEATEGCSSVGGFALQIGAPPAACEAPDPRPRLRFDAFSISDGGPEGGAGDVSGTAEPGEVVRLPVDISNFGNADARNIRGVLTLVSGPAGTLVSDPSTPWNDLRPAQSGTSAGAPAHVEVTIPASAACGAIIDLALAITYDGPAGTYSIDVAIPLLVGRVVEAFALDDDFETNDNGFTHGADCPDRGCDDWQRDLPTNAAAEDPLAAFSGTNVWGNDLGTLVAQGSNGLYRNGARNWLDSPPLDCSAFIGTRLSYQRWLSVEGGEFDQARVRISTAATPTDADWTTLWVNPDGAATVDTAWQAMEHDISAIADGQPTVRIRFELEADEGENHGGWNIDDMRVFTSRVVCGNCPSIGPPSSPGSSLRATGVKSETSAEFEWSRAGALQPNEEWRVYRGTAANAVTTLLSTPAFAGGSLLDSAAPGPLYFYQLLKANCLGIETP